MSKKICVFGYGNPGRQDDGLGPALAELLEGDRLPDVETDSNYQLNIENAYDISRCGAVIFVDASIAGEEPFSFEEIEPEIEIAFTSHSLSPQSVMALCGELYDAKIRAYVLGIRGYGWDLREELTPGARKNLEKALIFIKEKICELQRQEDKKIIFQ